jgi:hypothetical protein
LPLNDGASEVYEKNIGDSRESRLRTKTQESARKRTLSGNKTATDFGGIAAELSIAGDNCPTFAEISAGEKTHLSLRPGLN